MAGEQEVIKLFDIPAAEADAEKYYAIIAEVDERIKGVAGIGGNKTNDAATFRQQSAEMTAAMKQIAEMQQKLIDLEAQLTAARKKSSSTGKEKTDEELRASIQQRAETKLRTDAIKAEDDAYKQLALTYNRAAAEAKKLKAEAAKSGSDEAKQKATEAAAAAKLLNDQLKAIDKSVGDTRRNVGNYAEAFKEPFEELQKQLQKVESEMGNLEKKGATTLQNLSTSNPVGFNADKWKQNNTTSLAGGGMILKGDTGAFDAMGSKATLLKKTIADLSQEFTTSRQAERAYREATIQLGLALGQTDKDFVAFDRKVGESTNEINDLKAALKFNAQDGRALQSLISIAQGLAGAFGAAQAAIALTGDESEDTQKQMAKFQQILVLVTSLQAVNNTLQEENGAIQGVLAAKIALVNTAEKIKAFFTASSSAATEADTAANAENSTSQEVLAGTATEAGAAMEIEAGAAETATIATKSFSTTLIASGIGVALLAIGAAIVWVAGQIPAWLRGTKLTIEQQKELAEAAKQATDVLKEQAEMVEQLDGNYKRLYENLLAKSQAAGENQYKQFALRKQIAQEEHTLAQEQLDMFHAQGISERELAGEVDVLNMKRQEAIKLIEKYAAIPNPSNDDKMQLKGAQANLDLFGKLYDAAKNSYDAIRTAREKLAASDQKQAELELEQAKFHNAEIVQTTLESEKVRAEAIIQTNQYILNDQESTEAQRIKSQKNILNQQLALIEAERTAKLAAPDLTDEKRKQIDLEANGERVKAVKDSREKIKDINDEYDHREIESIYEVAKAGTDTLAAAADLVANDDKKSMADRLAAYQDYLSKQELLINLDANFQKTKKGLTNQELFAIDVDRQQKLIQLTADSQAKQSAIILSSLEKQKNTTITTSQINGLKVEIKALEELNNKLRAGTIGIDAYNKAKEKIGNKAATEALQLKTVALEFIRGEYAKNGQATMDIDKQIYENKKRLQALEIQGAIKTAEEKKLLREKELDLAKAGEEMIASFVKGGYESQLNKLQHQIDKNNELKETETARISSSTLSETEKAAALQRLAITTQTQNEAIQRKQRDIKVKEAQFDRDKAVLDVVGNTAIAISKAVAEFPLTAGEPWAAIAAAMGAVQIATILAKPIPKYEIGTDFAPGGLSMVHPGELRVNPDGSSAMTPEKPSLTFLERGTKIIPRDRVNRMMMQGILEPSGISHRENEVASEIRGLKEVVSQNGRDMVNAIRKQKAASMNVSVDNNFWVQIKDSI